MKKIEIKEVTLKDFLNWCEKEQKIPSEKVMKEFVESLIETEKIDTRITITELLNLYDGDLKQPKGTLLKSKQDGFIISMVNQKADGDFNGNLMIGGTFPKEVFLTHIVEVYKNGIKRNDKEECAYNFGKEDVEAFTAMFELFLSGYEGNGRKCQ